MNYGCNCWDVCGNASFVRGRCKNTVKLKNVLGVSSKKGSKIGYISGFLHL